MDKCKNCILRYHCNEQTEFYCKKKKYIYYQPKKDATKNFVGKRSCLSIYEDAIDPVIKDDIKGIIIYE